MLVLAVVASESTLTAWLIAHSSLRHDRLTEKLQLVVSNAIPQQVRALGPQMRKHRGRPPEETHHVRLSHPGREHR